MHRREFLQSLAASGAASALPAWADPDSRQATGIKIGETSPDSAIAWLRLTERAARSTEGILRAGRVAPFDTAIPTRDLHGSVPGAPGSVRLVYSTRANLSGSRQTPWTEVRADSDFSHQFSLAGLKPDTVYYYSAETRAPGGKLHAPLRGEFRTAPPRDSLAGVSFTMTTCQKYSQLDDTARGFQIYESMRKLNPRFFLSTGDIVYYDSDDPKATTIDLARYHWDRMFSFPRHIDLLSHIPGYWSKDDHDTLSDDVWPTREYGPEMKLTFTDGLRVFRQQVPMGARTYRTFRWGRTLQIWLVEGRDFRSANNSPDGPEKTIWGPAQKKWLLETMSASDADWKLLISPTPLVGPDRPNKADNHSNKQFAHEGKEFREWVKAHLPDNFFHLNGDRHWQYHSIHPETGTHEFSVGPASDSHAGGTPGENKNFHRFHRVMGGFLHVETTREKGESRIRLTHRDVAGNVVYEHGKSRKA
jgi:alkaline phosphatase D